jgi:iron complex transport system substrate-binding protein
MKLQNILLFFLLVSIFVSCKTEQKQTVFKENKTSIKYAKGFEIQYFDGYKKIIIKAPYPDAKEQFEYALIPKENDIPEALKNLKIIRTPIEQFVVTSTTHIPMLELLEVENNLVGFPNTQYISSSKTRQLIANGTIKELGKEENINTEVLLDLNPEMVVGFSLSSNNKMFENIEKAGIPVLLNGDWLEETPLGRAEWLKFFGILFNKEKLADSIFNTIEKDYIEAVLLAKEAKTKPTILSGVQFKDVWNLPAGESFVAKFLKDANTTYLWAASKGKGSLSLSFESVFEKAQQADLWIAPGHYTSYTQLKETNQHYTQFDAFTNKKIYSFNNKTGENGGVLYYELAPIQPHIVLKDIIKISHPELLPNYVPYFLEKLQD